MAHLDGSFWAKCLRSRCLFFCGSGTITVATNLILLPGSFSLGFMMQ